MADQPEVVAWAKAAADDPGGAGSLMLWGPTGTGKTHQAYGAVRIIAEAGPVEWGFFATSYPELMADLRPGSGSDETRDRVMRQVMRSPLVLLDDLGAARGTEWVEETLYRIVNHRYNHLLPTVFTSNSAPGELPTLLGDRIASRLVEMTRGSRVQVAGGDRRMVSR